MRKIVLFLAFIAGNILGAQAQTTANFDTLSLPGTDTAYINYSSYGNDVGFFDGLAYFPCVYDTSWGYEYWASGFAYSNETDSVTSGFGNQYAAKTGIGFAGSAQYAVASGQNNKIFLQSAAIGKSVSGLYLTNSTYAYNSMRDGDAFAKQFTAADSDWFRLDIFAYRADTLGNDSVSVYLADFRHTDSTKNYIISDWVWVDLLKLGNVDSLYLRLQSSDNGSFGMNTPAYFCIDNFTTNETGLKIAEQKTWADFKVFPNPASDYVYIRSNTSSNTRVSLCDLNGRILQQAQLAPNQELNLSVANLAKGMYFLQFSNGKQTASSKFIKQ